MNPYLRAMLRVAALEALLVGVIFSVPVVFTRPGLLSYAGPLAGLYVVVTLALSVASWRGLIALDGVKAREVRRRQGAAWLLHRARTFARVCPADLTTLYMLVGAFPGGIDERSYRPVIHLLRSRERPVETARSVATMLALYSGHPYGLFLNDIHGVDADKPGAEEVERVRSMLREYGYDKWNAGHLEALGATAEP
jgi:hypothetical protein